MIYSITLSIILIGILLYQAKRNARLSGENKSLKRAKTVLIGTLRFESKMSMVQVNELLKDINPDDIDPNRFTGLLRKKSSNTNSS